MKCLDAAAVAGDRIALRKEVEKWPFGADCVLFQSYVERLAELEKEYELHIRTEKIPCVSTPEFVFVIGGIAAGKTSFVHHTLRGHSYLDIDTLQTHPRDWNAPPEVIEEFDRGDAVLAHSKTMQWAIQRVAEWMDEKLELGTGDYVYMATGRRKDDLRDQMQRAKRSGYTVSLRLVKASDEARLERNRNRSRSLPDDRVVL